jgi:ABC-type dipeptide/oligopeptide/nickel transport system permease subunit
MKTLSFMPFRLILGCILFALAAAAGIFSPWLAPHDPLAADLSLRLIPPNPAYPLGTDQLGRCVFSRILAGTRISLSGAVAASVLSLLLGAVMGVCAALIRGWGRAFFTGLIDMGLALPGLILALVVSGLLGGGFQSLVIGLALANWPWWARLIRGLITTARQKDYVMAGRTAGLKSTRLLTHYLLPQVQGPVVAAAVLRTGRIILAFSSLTYLGLGPAPPAPEWGRMLQEAGIYMTRAPWLMLAPGLAITLVVGALNLMGNGLNKEVS